MENFSFLGQFLDIVLHLDKHLAVLVEQYGTWIYAILFLIIFCETGLVAFPFLPGDSLLFVAGTAAAGRATAKNQGEGTPVTSSRKASPWRVEATGTQLPVAESTSTRAVSGSPVAGSRRLTG